MLNEETVNEHNESSVCVAVVYSVRKVSAQREMC